MGGPREADTGGATSAGSRGLGVVLGGLFVLSGLTALVYEVIWFKRFAHVWGSAPLAMGAVVASFLLGLGVGAHKIGALSDRIRGPFRAYGWCELFIGVFALVVPLGMKLLAVVEGWAYPIVVDRPLVGALVRCALTFLVLGPPCILMGGTLPLLVKAFTARGEGIARSTGFLYALNTLGAAAGAFLAGFVLLPALGLRDATFVAVALNVGIALVAFALAPRVDVPDDAKVTADEPAPLAARTADPAAPAWLVPALAWGIGCAGLVLQVVWMRQTALVVGGSTYAFSAILVAILLGIGAGSLLYRAAFAGQASVAARVRTIQVLLGVLGGCAALGQMALPMLADFVATAVELRGRAFENAVICMTAGMALAFPASVCFGCLFPALVTAQHARGGTEGRTVGTISWWNTFGCLAGAILTPLVLIPAIGTTRSVAVAVALIAVAGLGAGRLGGGQARRRTLCLGAWGIALVLVVARPMDPLRLNSGAYSYGYVPFEERQEEVLFFAEGRACNVLVTAHPNRALRLNGKVDAGDANDMPTQLGCAYFPRMLRPDAKDALVLGFGSGTTCGAMLLFPESRVTCCEIEEEVYHASEHFAHVNHSPEDSPDFSVRFLDGRAHLQGSAEEYDLVVSVPSNPWMAGIGNLFTRSFYEAAQSRLRADGLFVQWVQTYEMPQADYAMILRTISSVFDTVAILRIDDLDTLVFACDGALLPDRAGLQRAAAQIAGLPTVVTDLERYFGTADVSRLLARHFLVGPDGVREMNLRDADGELHTDDNLRLEFDAARRQFAYTPETDAFVRSGVNPIWQRRVAEAVPDRAAAVSEWEQVVALVEGVAPERADELCAVGYRLAPEDPFFLMRETVQRPPEDDAEFRARVFALGASRANTLGTYFWQGGDYERAIAVYELMLERWPNSATIWANLAVSLRPTGDAPSAAEAIQKAHELDPLNEFVSETVRSE